MTLVDTVTGEVIETTYAEVRASVARTKNNLEAAAEEIVWQIERQAWTTLGHANWNEMREAEYGGAAFMVPRAERPELVARMRQSGLTQQDIADTAGVSQRTVSDDLNSNSANEPAPVITNARGQQRPPSYSRPAPPEPPPAATVEDAVTEFPDLAHYAETGRASDAVSMAGDLRRYRETGELVDRLATLRRSVEIDQAKRNGTHAPPAMAKVCHACGQLIEKD